MRQPLLCMPKLTLYVESCLMCEVMPYAPNSAYVLDPVLKLACPYQLGSAHG